MGKQIILGKRAIAALSAVLLALTLALAGCSAPAQTQAGSSSTSASSSAAEQTAAIQASVSIVLDDDGQTAARSDISFEPFEGKTVELSENATAYDALIATGADVVSEDGSYGMYVTSIDGLANGSEGSSSGWTYTVNDEMPSESADSYVLSDGDKVVWTFVTSFE